ncbi:hypothetical protein EHQ68_04275 [Leptospira congkakensis]|uniref:Uncharacterized protein n=1 Tax=Leptospira congkakensis TaxID=2484932 RepID=A0A4Z1A6M7_9LEPT|nr:hypothetical protein [Leptospira congkakensis]TGL90650.1 hypothetical protein EHQ69_12035 [Leptospira congkakensis]TGL91657.1 hypothetical protein EHQ68_04275 [Leptospira congkakensis]TGL98709.1 hypothetical protein EHQ70_03860 [Leptospira congkakensis]
MIDPTHVSTSPSMQMTDYHSRRLGISFASVGAHLGWVYLAGEIVYEFGRTEKEEWLRSLVSEKSGELVRSLEFMEPKPLGTFAERGKDLKINIMRLPEGEVPVFVLVVQEIEPELSDRNWEDLSNQVLTFCATGISMREKNLLDFQTITEPIRKKMERSFSGEVTSGVIAFFHLQDLSPFFKPMGVVKSQEILREVTTTLHKETRENEFNFQLNPRSYFLFCPGETLDGANNRFGSLYFPSKHLILDYKLKIFPIDREILADDSRFSSIFIENF